MLEKTTDLLKAMLIARLNTLTEQGKKTHPAPDVLATEIETVSNAFCDLLRNSLPTIADERDHQAAAALDIVTNERHNLMAIETFFANGKGNGSPEHKTIQNLLAVNEVN